MRWNEIIPPIKNMPFKDELRRGYTDFSKFPKWAWLFEVVGGALDECLRDTITRLRDGSETRYCRQAYVRITDDNNQHVVIALMRDKPRVTWDAEGKKHVEHVINFHYMALVPRFMGVLRDAEGYIIFYMEDGKVADAIKALTLSPSTVVNIINKYFPPPYHVITKGLIKDVLFSAIHKVDLMKLEPSVRDELVNQLKSVDEDVVFL
jgi:hypothetical protein